MHRSGRAWAPTNAGARILRWGAPLSAANSSAIVVVIYRPNIFFQLSPTEGGARRLGQPAHVPGDRPVV
eukprot:524368-Prymnesium_polylepis.1